MKSQDTPESANFSFLCLTLGSPQPCSARAFFGFNFPRGLSIHWIRNLRISLASYTYPIEPAALPLQLKIGGYLRLQNLSLGHLCLYRLSPQRHQEAVASPCQPAQHRWGPFSQHWTQGSGGKLAMSSKGDRAGWCIGLWQCWWYKNERGRKETATDCVTNWAEQSVLCVWFLTIPPFLSYARKQVQRVKS